MEGPGAVITTRTIEGNVEFPQSRDYPTNTSPPMEAPDPANDMFQQTAVRVARYHKRLLDEKVPSDLAFELTLQFHAALVESFKR